jgi:tRNA threonylcarbamoyl adenosine modification protein YeaZ
MILAIDSSTGTSVALVSAEGLTMSEASSDNPRGHAEVIGNLMGQVLDESGVARQDLQAVVMGVGPGPFTGLRVGMAAARAVAWANQIPLWPVVSLDAAAYGREGRVLIWSDQKRRERAWAVYSLEDGVPVSHKLPVLHPADEFSEVVTAHPDCDVMEARSVKAADLARVAIGRQARGLSLVGPQALYLRAPDVTLAP